MRFKINRNLMLELLKSIYKVVPKDSPMKELTCFKIEANEDDGYLYVTATNLEVSVQRKLKIQIESGGSMLMEAKFMYEMMQLLSGDEVEISLAKEGVAEVKSGKCTYTRRVMDTKSYPNIDIPCPGTMSLVSNLAQMYAKTKATVMASGVPDGMKGIHFDVRSNGFRVISCNLQNICMVNRMMECNNCMEFTLPKVAYMYLALAAGDDEIYVGQTDTHVVFKKDDLLFSARKLEKEFVNVDNILGKLTPVYSAKIEYDDFKPQFENTYSVAAMGAKTSYICLELDGDKMTLSTQNDIGKCSNDVNAVRISGDEKLKFYYPAQHLRNVFDTVEDAMIVQVDKRGYILIRDKTNKFMLTSVSDSAVQKQLSEFATEKKPKKTTKKKAESKKKAA